MAGEGTPVLSLNAALGFANDQMLINRLNQSAFLLRSLCGADVLSPFAFRMSGKDGETCQYTCEEVTIHLMKLDQPLRLVLLLAAILTAGIPAASLAADHLPASRPNIYDTAADGQQQIAAALKTAQTEDKRVILKFGANWCGWCHRLSGLLKTNAELARILKDNFILVLIDVDKEHNADVVKKYGNPTRFGLPVLVVLDTDGTPLTTQDTGKLEEGDRHDPAKVKAFLEKWRKPNPAKG